VSRGWVEASALGDLAAEGTTAHRVWSGRTAWIERFGEDFLLSDPDGDDRMVGELRDWTATVGLEVGRIFLRKLVKQPGESDLPRLVVGDAGAPPRTVASERGLRFAINFEAGYSVGLFCDQRGNRAYLESLRPERVLNCFAYTGAFSVAAARVGAATLSVDLAGKALETGRRNFELNGLGTDRHRFFVDDVFRVLPRLARRGERFDVIVMDPPTFSRGKSGRIFQADEDFGRLIEMAVELVDEDGWMLVSTNCRKLDATALRRWGGEMDVDPDGPVSDGSLPGTSSTLWLRR
jgi:23S rRNA (cytosine1962-C5)-methyltransferase